jgi:hypothetical protein
MLRLVIETELGRRIEVALGSGIAIAIAFRGRMQSIYVS